MRKLLLFILVGLTGLIFVGRLLYLQVFRPDFLDISENNAIKTEYIYPERGFIYDRDGHLLVSNQPSYDVMAIPQDVRKFDTVEFAELLGVEPEYIEGQLGKAKIYSRRLPSIIVSQLSKEDYAVLQEKLRKFPGFYIQKRSLRDYQFHKAANVLGYIAQVNQKEVDEKPYYDPGDLIGRSGVERQYEKMLRGKKGVKYYQKNRFGKEIGSYKDGKFDTLAEKGKDLTLTLDMDLQAYGDSLMKNKRGGIVAIQPSSGEILSLVTAPSYDPSLLVGRKRSENFTKLWNDTLRLPLMDRTLTAMYPPGSSFKPISGAVALQEGVIDQNTQIACHHGFNYGINGHMDCSDHPSPLSVSSAIQYSCNTFFAKSYWRMIDNYGTPQEGMDTWHDYMSSFGLGDFLGYDLPTGRKGFIPDADYYNSAYHYPKYHWGATYTLSNGIGQGEVLVTPIQLANVTTAIANRGWFYTPHVLKEVNDEPIENEEYTKKKQTKVDSENFEPIVDGMRRVYKDGTARFVQIPDIKAAGKTGTAENYTKIGGERVQLSDHSIFVAFAPKDDPEIALSVFVENGHWGSRYAAKIASLMIEKYLKDKVERKDLEEWILDHSLKDEYKKKSSGEPFEINQ